MSKKPTKKDLVLSLNPDSAQEVLLILLNEDPDLIDRVYQVAERVLSDVDSDGVMNDVYSELEALDVDVLYGRSGRSSYGYTDPADESWVMFEEALEPFIAEMKEYQKRAMPKVAKEYCIGIFKGIREFETESRSDFLDWVVDAPGECIDNVFSEWKKGQPSEDDIAEIAQIIKDLG